MKKWHPTEFCENCYKEWCCTSECRYHLLYRIKEAREEIKSISQEVPYKNQAFSYGVSICETANVLKILDKLIEENEV